MMMSSHDCDDPAERSANNDRDGQIHDIAFIAIL
jgi:hypothetical protein